MVNFRELVEGKVPAQDNPFWHHRLTGDRTWDMSDNRVKLHDGNLFNKQGQLELMVKAGWRIEIELKQENDNYFETAGYAEARKDSRFKAFGAGTPIRHDSVAQFTLFGGSALAVSSESLSLSETYESDSLSGGLGNTSWAQLEEHGSSAGGGFWGGVATHVYLAPAPLYFVGGEYMRDPNHPEDFPRTIKWADGDDSVYVKLIGIERIPEADAVQDNTSSQDSEGITDRQRDDAGGSISVWSEWDYDTLYEKQEDPEGWFYDISVAFEKYDQIYAVFVNGIQVNSPSWGMETPFEENAVELANDLQDQFQDSGLPTIYRHERAPPETPPPKDDSWSWQVWAGIIVVGLFGVIFVYSMASAVGRTATEKVLGGGTDPGA